MRAVGAVAAMRRGARALLADSLGQIASVIASEADGQRVGRFLLRELTDENGSFDIVYGGLLHPVLDRLAALLDVVTERTLTPETLRIRSLALLGQLQVFVLFSPLVTRHLGVDAVDDALSTRIAEQLRFD